MALAVAIPAAAANPAVQAFFAQLSGQAAEASTAVDPNTTNQWLDHIAPDGEASTQNIGRIWTDKSVFDTDYTFEGQISETVGTGDSDFLVGLSALSSTSNVRETITTTEPLDIVLVLDDSGSMDDDMSMEAGYYEVSAGSVVASTGHIQQGGWQNGWAIQDTNGGTYYALVDGEYVRISEITSEVSGSLWSSYNEHVRWELNGQAVTPEDTTFYEYIGGSISRTDALQRAVNSFIDQTATMNASIADEADKIRLSIVVFASSASTENGLTVCEGENVATLKATVNSLNGSGATNAGAGMANANSVLSNSDRSDANQVVIFFTDGVPTTQSSFSQTVANTAVTNAGSIKSRGGIVYSIGIFDGADPSQVELPNYGTNDTDRANVFMNAVSSNYPNSTAWNTLGGRASEDADYYKATGDAGELSDIFDEIFNDSTSDIGSGSPIEEVTTGGANNTPGNLVFTDQLGSYMEVTGTGAGADKMQLAYGDQLITSDSRDEARNSADNATIYTYRFSGTVEGNDVYHEANLADFSVVVTSYDDSATGDLVTVTIPASLIPMRNYDVDVNNGTMSVSEAYPVRLFYGVSLKDEAADAIADPTSNPELYSAIVSSSASDDKSSLDFYSNAYGGGTDGATTASFTPSAGNRFYYYTENEQLYLDEGCTQPATLSNISSNSGTLYYEDTYWQQGENNSATQETVSIAVDVSGSDLTFVRYDESGNAYIPVGTQRLDRPNTLTKSKSENVTGTATNVLHPAWTGGEGVTQYLGNNGKMQFDLPGDLVIAKTVDWGNASDSTKENQKTFTFQVDFNGADDLAGSFAYEVLDASDERVSAGTVSDGGTVSLEGGQRAVITGLPTGTTYTVTEQGANTNGFTTTDNSTAAGADTADGVVEGMIVGGSQQIGSFNNAYSASNPVDLSTSTTLNVRKVLDGREWRDSDSFTFNLAPVAGAPAPADGEVEITNATGSDHTAAFGDITFTAVGEYRYIITEENDNNPIVGIDYSDAVYRVIVNVVDGGNGNLAIGSVTIDWLRDDEGAENTSVVQGDTVTFTNHYLSDQGSTAIDGFKVYNDTTGGNSIQTGEFTFRLEALGGYDTGNKPEDGTYTYAADETPMPTGAQDNVITTDNTGSELHFPSIYFDGNDVGRTYEYKVTEVPGNEQGMTYDSTEYTLLITVTEENDGEGEDAHAHIVATPSIAPADLKFTNTYDPDDATLTGDVAIHGTKVLNGRSMLEGETFYFELTQTGGPETVLTAPEIATVAAADGDMNFNFSDMTFSKTGDYTFTVNEVADANGTETVDGNGLTYSQNICTVTVHVADNGDGTLSANAAYSNTVGTDNSQAVFTNTYTASMSYGTEGGITVTKQLLDRNMSAGDFSFTITGEGDAAGMVSGADASFQNPAMGANATASMRKLQSLTFNQTHADNTYTFIVDEVDPAESEGLAGVVYDQSQYRVEITPVDNGDGTMYALTTVTRIVNATGEPVEEVVIDQADSRDEAIPTFGFVNDYNPNPAVIGDDADTALQVTKTVTGAPSPDGVEYSFTLTAQDTSQGSVANIGGLDENNQLTVHTTGVINADVNDSADDSQTVSFGELTFSAPGTYTFTVQENEPAADEGWVYDTTPKTVRVVVTDRNADGQYDGNLYIQSVTGNPVTVTNSYTPGSVTVGGGDIAPLTVQKTVTGNDTQTDFAFSLRAADPTDKKWANVESVDPDYDRTATVTEDFADGDVRTATFDSIRFKAAGTYEFKIAEIGTDEAPGGWTYDAHEATVVVTVTDTDFDGFLEASVAYDNSAATTDADKGAINAAAFTNIYDAGSTDVNTGDADAQLTKVLEGKTWNGESFTFQIQSVSNTAGIEVADMPMPNDDDGNGDSSTVTVAEATDPDNNSATFSFGTITFDTPGEYVYEVTELPGDNEGITYSDNKATITITVVDDNDGTYSTSVTITGNTFTNVYHSELDYVDNGGGFVINKVLDGTDIADGQFSFTVDPKDQATADKLHLDIDGQTVAVPAAAMTAEGIARSTVNVFGTADQQNDHLFTQEDAGKAYTFTVRENVPDPVPAGYDYDDTVYTVTVTAEDNGQGGLTVTTKVTNDRTSDEQTFTYDTDPSTQEPVANVTFSNSYDATGTLGGEGNARINATKQLTNRPLEAGEFTFSVRNAASAGESGLVATGTNTADGTIVFGQISYSLQQIEQDVVDGLATHNADGTYTYTYMVSEDDADLPEGVAVVTPSFTISVNITDNADGTLGIEVVYPEGDGLTFQNTYGATAEAELDINGTKVLAMGEGANNAPDITGKYTFTLTGSDGAPMPENTTATNDASGTVSFGTIEFTMNNVFGTDAGASVDAIDEPAADEAETAEEAEVAAQSAPQTKTFTYTVTESGSVAGVTNDPQASQTFTVTATDNGDGTISVAAFGTSTGSLFTFTNTYDVSPQTSSPTGDGGLTITKNLTGRDLAAGEFTAVMKDAGNNEVARGSNDVDGNISLGSIEFYAAGTYEFTIYELNDAAGGVSYDDARYKATATVTDNGDGTLAVAWSFADAQNNPLEGDSITFNNVYEAAPTTVKLGGNKVLDGRDLSEGEFEFALTAVDGAPMPVGAEDDIVVVKNNAQGGFIFDTITFDEAGSYTYKLTEVLPEDDDAAKDGIQKDNVTYDETSYTVKVTIVDDGEGHLVLTGLTYNDEAKFPVFTNTYVEPPASVPGDDGDGQLMQTDDPVVTMIAATAILSACFIGTGMVLRKKRGE